MVNTKPIGVAYADPELVSGTTITDAVISGSTVSGTLASTATSGPVVSNGTAGLYFLTTAITANTTATTAPVGSLATTTNATGKGKLFISDGSKWQSPVVA